MWRFIFNTNRSFAQQGFSTRDKAAESVRATGYKFFSWNGDIYFLTKDGYEDTGIDVVDLESGHEK